MEQAANLRKYVILQDLDPGFGVQRPPEGFARLDTNREGMTISLQVKNLREGAFPYTVILVYGQNGEMGVIRAGTLEISSRNGFFSRRLDADAAQRMSLQPDNILYVLIAAEHPEKTNIPMVGICNKAYPWNEAIRQRLRKDVPRPAAEAKANRKAKPDPGFAYAGSSAPMENLRQAGPDIGKSTFSQSQSGNHMPSDMQFNRYSRIHPQSHETHRDISAQTVAGTNTDMFSPTPVDIGENIFTQAPTEAGKDSITSTQAEMSKDSFIQDPAETGKDNFTQAPAETGKDIFTQPRVEMSKDSFTQAPAETGKDIFTQPRVEMSKDSFTQAPTETGKDSFKPTQAEMRKDTFTHEDPVSGTDNRMDIKPETGDLSETLKQLFSEFKKAERKTGVQAGNFEKVEKTPGKKQDAFEKPKVDDARLERKLRDNFEVMEPFSNPRHDYSWYRVNDLARLSNLLFSCNIHIPLFANPKILVGLFKYRHLLAGFYRSERNKMKYFVLGVPSRDDSEGRPFERISRWVEVQNPDYGDMTGYWLVYINLQNGEFVR